MGKYMCINCNEEFDELFPIKKGECETGYIHRLIRKSDIKKSAIIPNKERGYVVKKKEKTADEIIEENLKDLRKRGFLR